VERAVWPAPAERRAQAGQAVPAAHRDLAASRVHPAHQARPASPANLRLARAGFLVDEPAHLDRA
jgi:hypothetical protein